GAHLPPDVDCDVRCGRLSNRVRRAEGCDRASAKHGAWCAHVDPSESEWRQWQLPAGRPRPRAARIPRGDRSNSAALTLVASAFSLIAVRGDHSITTAYC